MVSNYYLVFLSTTPTGSACLGVVSIVSASIETTERKRLSLCSKIGVVHAARTDEN